MTKVTLIQPSFGSRMVQIPMGIAYLAAVLEKNDVDVSLIDLNISDEKEIEKVKSSDIVGISVKTESYPSAASITEKIKETDSDIPIMWGGVHPTILADECLKNLRIDYCVIGEGERTVVELVDAIANNGELNGVKGIAFKNNGQIVHTEPRPLIENINEIPFPAYHLLGMDKYIYCVNGVDNVRRYPWACIFTSRGCPHNCIFCYRFFGQRYRARSPENVLAEMEFLIDKYGIREFFVLDENFTLQKDRVMKICDMIIEKNLDILFRCPSGVRADIMDREMLEKLKAAGMYKASFGIESASEEILKRAKKNLDLNKVKDAVKLCKEVGVETVGYFIIGLPGETIHTAMKTIKFAKELPLNDAMFFIATPLPATEFYDWTVEKGFLQETDWSKYKFSSYKSVCKTDDLTSEQIVNLVRLANRQFYLRPNVILRKLSRMRHPNEFRVAFSEVLSWLKGS